MPQLAFNLFDSSTPTRKGLGGRRWDPKVGGGTIPLPDLVRLSVLALIDRRLMERAKNPAPPFRLAPQF